MKTKKRMNKKASITDGLFIPVFIFAIIIIFIITFFLLDNVNTELNNTLNIPTKAANINNNNVSRFPAIFDGIILFLIVGLSLAAVVGAFAIRSSPVFFGVAIIFLLVIGAINLILEDTFFAFAGDSEISASANQFTASTFIMQKFPFIMAVIGFLIAIITYARGSPTP